MSLSFLGIDEGGWRQGEAKTIRPVNGEMNCLSDNKLQLDVHCLSSVTSSSLVKLNASWLLKGSIVGNSLENDAVERRRYLRFA